MCGCGVCGAGVLASCINAGVVVVRYVYENTSLTGILQMVRQKLRGRLALSIALLVNGKPGSIKICSQKVQTGCIYTRTKMLCILLLRDEGLHQV